MGITHLTRYGLYGKFKAEVKGTLQRRGYLMLVSLDSRKRAPLGKLLQGNSTNLFNAELVDGKIVLEPMRAVPEREVWLYKNPKALASVKRGLKDAAQGRVVDFDPDKD